MQTVMDSCKLCGNQFKKRKNGSGFLKNRCGTKLRLSNIYTSVSDPLCDAYGLELHRQQVSAADALCEIYGLGRLNDNDYLCSGCFLKTEQDYRAHIVSTTADGGRAGRPPRITSPPTAKPTTRGKVYTSPFVRRRLKKYGSSGTRDFGWRRPNRSRAAVQTMKVIKSLLEKSQYYLAFKRLLKTGRAAVRAFNRVVTERVRLETKLLVKRNGDGYPQPSCAQDFDKFSWREFLETVEPSMPTLMSSLTGAMPLWYIKNCSEADKLIVDSRLGMMLTIPLYTHRPNAFKFIQSMNGFKMWQCGVSSNKLYRYLNQLGICQCKSVARKDYTVFIENGNRTMDVLTQSEEGTEEDNQTETMSGGKQKGFGFGGFAIKPKGTSVETQLAQMGYGLPGMAGRSHSSIMHIGKKRVRNEDEYFEDDDDEQRNLAELEYLPAPGSPTLERMNAANKQKDNGSDSDSSDDPLDAFMADIEKEVKTQDKKETAIPEEESDAKGKRDDIEEEDDQESYFRYMEENPTAGLIQDDDDIIDYDEDGNPIMPDKRIIDPLPPIDHSEIQYARFNKNFYEEHEEISAMTPDQMVELRKKIGIHVSGILAPKPVSSFAHFGFDDRLMKTIRKSGYTQPTPIQAQGVPIALSGRDIIGIAKTGSGKTAAYLWPLLIHIMDQKELQPGDGPIGLICAPTRELSQQIYQEAKKFGKVYNINVVCAYGGGNLYEQCKACEEGAEIIVATPGRLIDLVKKKATDLSRVTYLVFDEADRMFDMGFEPQVRSIADHVRPDRQTLMFSATFRKRVERVARDILTDPLRVVQGDAGEANEDITQIVKVIHTEQGKWTWLLSNLVQFTTVGSVLIFVTRKSNCEELANNLKHNDFQVGLLHGDMSQVERNEIITSFKHKAVPILVATDVAARGLDIPHIRVVVNYDVARDIDTHTHRIGRTGRAGEKGTAYTLITTKDKDFAGHLVRNLEGANQFVPQELMDIAMQNPWFKKNRFQQQKAKKLNMGGSGLGFKERPGLGAKSSTSTNSSSLPSYAMSNSKGPQSDRVAAMKAAFAAQFKVNFVSAATHAPNDAGNWTTSATMEAIPVPGTEPGAPPQPQPSSSKRRRTRWDD